MYRGHVQFLRRKSGGNCDRSGNINYSNGLNWKTGFRFYTRVNNHKTNVKTDLEPPYTRKSCQIALFKPAICKIGKF